MEKEQLIQLVTKAQAGDQTAMDGLFTACYNDIYYFALKTLKDQDLACDITQETFLTVIQSIGGLKEPAAFGTWIRQIAYHHCTRHFARKKEVLVQEDEEGNSIFDTLADESEGVIPADILEQQEFRQTIMGMIDQLTEEQRSAVLLYYFEELTVGQIAKVQNVSEGTVKSRLNYARKAIKRSVESYEKKHNIKLHSFSLLPLLLLFFRKEDMPAQKAQEMRVLVAKAAKGAAGAALGGKLAASPLVTKVIAGVVAGALVLAGVALAVKELATEPEGKTEYAAPYEETKEEDSVLSLVRNSMEYRDAFLEYMDGWMGFYRTVDGKVAKVHKAGEAHTIPADAEFIWTSNGLPSYRDSEGMIYCMVGGDESQWISLPGEDIQSLVGAVWRSEEKKSFLVNYVDVNGVAWGCEVDAQTGEMLERKTVPIVDADTNAPLQNIEKFGSPANCGYRVIADGWIYESMDALKAKNTGVPADGLLSDLRAEWMIWKDGGAVYVDGQAVSLPEGKEVVKAYVAGVSVFVFDDGSVYLYGTENEPAGLWYCQELTELNLQGRIKQICFAGAGEEATAVFVLDDNLSYVLNLQAAGV